MNGESAERDRRRARAARLGSAQHYVRARLLIAVTASITVILAAPFVGQLRGAIEAAMPDQYRQFIGGTVGVAVTSAIAVALWRIRERRALRYGLLALAVVGGAGYSFLTATGNANVDAVESFHFVEYGLLTLLFYRVWRDRADLTAMLLPLLAVFIVGALDEGMQWFVPGRVGEWRDVLLNGAAILCGLLFGLGLDPPAAVSTKLDRAGRLALARVGGSAVVVCAMFFQVVHLGYEIRHPEIGSFRSRFSADELRQAAEKRAQHWRVEPPTVLRRLSREDQYLAEGLWHLQRRNEVERAGGAWAQWKENLIMERYFAPVLEFPTYTTPAGARWLPEQRENVRAAAAARNGAFVSDAHPFPIYTWDRRLFRSATAAAIILVLILGLVPGDTNRARARQTV